VFLHSLGSAYNSSLQFNNFFLLVNLQTAVNNIHIDSVDGGASRGTRCVAWPSSPSFSDGETSDDDSDDVGLTSAASVSNDRHVAVAIADVATVITDAGDEESDSKNKQAYSIHTNVQSKLWLRDHRALYKCLFCYYYKHSMIY